MFNFMCDDDIKPKKTNKKQLQHFISILKNSIFLAPTVLFHTIKSSLFFTVALQFKIVFQKPYKNIFSNNVQKKLKKTQMLLHLFLISSLLYTNN